MSVASDGTQSNGSSEGPTISADGRFVGFYSFASNLVSGDSNGVLDAFVGGGVSVGPTAVNVPAAGGARSVTVTFDYPGTPWTATTTAPWITLTPPIGGSTSGAVAFTVAANNGPQRTATITVALQTVTVTQDPFTDLAPPTVTPPASITVYATTPTGATAATLPALAAFLNGATAVDDSGAAPTPQPPQLNGAAVTATTEFPIGVNTVAFSFTDAAGHVGTATSTVTVLAGRPAFSVSIVGAIAAAGQQSTTLRVTNTGAGNALGLSVALASLRTLAGSGTVTLVSGLPATVAVLVPGQSFDIPVVINVPTTVTRFALSESLATTDYTGAILSTSATQTIFPADVTAPTVLNNGPALTPARLTVTVTWQTSEPTTGGVAYGFGTSTNNQVPEDSVYATSHSITLTGLVPNTTISVIVFGHDPARNAYVSIRKTVITNP
jgi:hypothetical protein